MAVLLEAGGSAVAIEADESLYDVGRDGSLVCSKQCKGRFPEDYEVLEALSG